MSPHKPIHSGLQGAIQRMLILLKPEGYVLPELAVHTRDGTKTLDVAWVSRTTYESQSGKDAFERAPEIAIEVVSGGNTMAEMEFKKNLYLERGAIEVWVCREDGEMLFFAASGRLDQSSLCPGFPRRISDRIQY